MPRLRGAGAGTSSYSDDSDNETSSLRAPSALKGKNRDTAGPLQRGSACLTCRKRKLKCDAGKPVCHQCIRAGNESECSYDNGKALSKTQILQQRIAHLEAKLTALQGRGASSGSSPASSTSSVTNGGHPATPSLSGKSSRANTKDSLDASSSDPFGLVGSDSTSIGIFSSSLYGDSAFSSSLDYDPSTIAPQLITVAGNQSQMSPFLQSTIDLYDANGAWPAANSSSTDLSTGLPGPAQMDPSSSASLFSSPSHSSYNLAQVDTADGSSQSGATSSGPSATIASSTTSSNLNFQTSLRSMQDPNCITATEQGRRYLLNLFLPQRQRYYFDVHVGRFIESVQHPDPRKRPHPCLMDAIYLLACYISRDDSVRQYEAGLLSRARQGLCESLEHSDRLWNFVQASTLIAFYLYQNGRFIEAYHQTCQVARFAVSCGSHQISSPFMSDPKNRESTAAARTQAPWTVTNMSVRRAGSMLEPPKDQIEIGERILAFWHIFLLDRCGSIMTNLPAALPDECDSFSQIETVWPRTLEEYEKGEVYESDYGTLRFLYQPDTSLPGRADTIFTLRLKASALFERASRLGSRYSSNMNEQTFALFRTVDFAIARFSNSIPFARNTGAMGEIPQPPTAPVNAQLVFVHTLALTATMRLHYLAAKDESISYAKRLHAAEATVVVANELMGSSVDYSEFDMLLGYCWKTACDVFILERQITADPVTIAALDSKIDTLVGHMQTLQTVFPLTVFQINEVVQARATVVGNAAVLAAPAPIAV
ncbi:hypothetical protein DL93DRAFT_2208478 [Clavulina sp. PMI_390]|nr:hypothetical protein DL93DRAFT_2208478 [Clavulina sp. PMI_390]